MLTYNLFGTHSGTAQTIFTALFVMAFLSLPKVGTAHSGPAKNFNSTAFNQKETGTDMEKATFGGGCFWCVEAVFQRVEGVDTVISGYSGGHVKNPSYREVTTGTTGHAEVVQIIFNPEVISFDNLLKIFFKTHDPTQLNRQGADVGPQYRSVVFYHNSEQKEKTEYYINKLNEEGVFDKKIVTEVSAFEEFYPAEDYHQNYYNKNSSAGYCQFVIVPKLQKLEEIFSDKLKEDAEI